MKLLDEVFIHRIEQKKYNVEFVRNVIKVKTIKRRNRKLFEDKKLNRSMDVWASQNKLKTDQKDVLVMYVCRQKNKNTNK